MSPSVNSSWPNSARILASFGSMSIASAERVFSALRIVRGFQSQREIVSRPGAVRVLFEHVAINLRRFCRLAGLQQIIRLDALGGQLAVAELVSCCLPELLDDLRCLLVWPRERSTAASWNCADLSPGFSATAFRNWGSASIGLSHAGQNEPELISSLKIVGRPGGSKLKFRLCLGVIAQSAGTPCQA